MVPVASFAATVGFLLVYAAGGGTFGGFGAAAEPADAWWVPIALWVIGLSAVASVLVVPTLVWHAFRRSLDARARRAGAHALLVFVLTALPVLLSGLAVVSFELVDPPLAGWLGWASVPGCLAVGGAAAAWAGRARWDEGAPGGAATGRPAAMR